SNIVVMTQANTRFSNQSWRKQVGVDQGGAVYGLLAGTLETTLTGTTGRAEYGLFIVVLYHPAEEGGQAIILRPIEVQLGIERSCMPEKARRVMEVVGKARQIRMRHQRQNFLSNRTYASRINHVGLAVKGELRPARSSCSPGGRVIDIAVRRLGLAA